MINQINQSEINRALDRENYRYFKILTYQIAMQTLLAGRNTNVTSSEVVVSRTTNAVNDEEDSSEFSEVPVTGSRIMNEE